MRTPQPVEATFARIVAHNARLRGGGRLDELDGLRAIAVIPVIALHFGAAVDGGAGVTVFFALSGYIVTTLLLEERSRSGRIDIAAFYARRARRLIPAASLVVLTTVLVGQFTGRPVITRQAFAALTYWANFERFTQEFTYGMAAYAPLEHFWSLAIEEQFYLVLPVLLMVAMQRGRRVTFMVCALLATVSAIVALSTLDDPRMYFHTAARVGELLLGVMAAISGLRLPRWLGLVGLVGLGAVFAEFVSVPYIAVAGLATVVICSRPVVLAAPPLVTIGAYSYSLYLWHPLAALTADDAVIRVVVTAILAVASFHLVEHPIRRNLPIRRASWSTAAINAAALASVAAVAIVHTPVQPTFAAETLDSVLSSTSTSRPTDSGSPESSTAIRISGVGDSTQMFASATWRAWADRNSDVLQWIEPPTSILPWTSGADDWIRDVAPGVGLVLPYDGPQGGLDRQGCPLVHELAIRPVDSWAFFDTSQLHSPVPEATCDWNRWIPDALAEMDLDVVVATWAVTAMWQYRMPDGSVGQVGEPAFDALLVARMTDFEQMAGRYGTKVLWLTYDLAHDDPSEDRRLTILEDRFAALALARPCAADLREIVRDTPEFEWYQDGYHFTVGGAVRALEAILPAMRACAASS